MIEKEDYRTYLSIDNGKGLLLNDNDVFILDQFGIDYKAFSSIKELIFVISNYIDDHFDEEVEDFDFAE